MNVLYTATAHATGDGRNGHARSDDGYIDLDLRVPPEMGGPGGATNPEELFAAGYAACFGGALDFVAHSHKKDAAKATITCSVSIGPRDGGGFGLAVNMSVVDPGLPQAELEAFVKEAHEHVCPYSHATRDNIPITFEVKGG